ncbi:hypothetical protein Plec18167_009265 [Paecilomyces lecythidis]|uniref:Aspergillopepsin n=1 Tax=Paecilomyces lecythidis TaxID=3004212 RepID=A0ABR3WQT9_9EURO
MKFSTILLSNALFAASVLAAPRGGGLARRLEARAVRSHQSHPLIPEGSTTTKAPNGSNDTHVQYSSNWAGAVLESPPSGQTFNQVSGVFTVPTPSAPSGASGSSAASAWVGIDGDTYTNAILQTGIDFTVGDDGSVSYDAWYEWYPDYAYDFDGFDISSGDVISLSVKSSSSSSGEVVIENQTTGKQVSKTLSAPDSSSTLGGQNAEWIVEDFEQGNNLVPFADFGSVTFSNAEANTGSGSVGTDGATILDIRQNNQVLTDTTIPSSSEVTVTYE